MNFEQNGSCNQKMYSNTSKIILFDFYSRYSNLIPSMTSKPISHRYKQKPMHQPSQFKELPTIQVSRDDENQPIFKADTLDHKNNFVTKSVLPQQSFAMTPFRPRSQRIGLFDNEHFLETKMPNESELLKSNPDETNTVHTPTKTSSRHLDIFSLLTTPVPSARKDKSRGILGFQVGTSERCHTPQSILKVKRRMSECLQSEEMGSPSLRKSDEIQTDVEQDRYGFT